MNAPSRHCVACACVDESVCAACTWRAGADARCGWVDMCSTCAEGRALSVRALLHAVTELEAAQRLALQALNSQRRSSSSTNRAILALEKQRALLEEVRLLALRDPRDVERPRWTTPFTPPAGLETQPCEVCGRTEAWIQRAAERLRRQAVRRGAP
jgi:hypothetical protein